MNSSSEEQMAIPSSVEEEEPKHQIGKKIADHAMHYVRILGSFVRLLLGRMLDPRVDKKVKIFAGSVLAYVFSPVDFIPEMFSGLFGMLDDFVLSAFALNVILNWVDPEIVREHWHGNNDLLTTVQKAIKNSELLVPDAILKKIEFWIGKHSAKAIVPVTATPAPAVEPTQPEEENAAPEAPKARRAPRKKSPKNTE